MTLEDAFLNDVANVEKIITRFNKDKTAQSLCYQHRGNLSRIGALIMIEFHRHSDDQVKLVDNVNEFLKASFAEGYFAAIDDK